jgi:lipopolysaccharide biosynthesis regulator YciM
MSRSANENQTSLISLDYLKQLNTLLDNTRHRIADWIEVRKNKGDVIEVTGPMYRTGIKGGLDIGTKVINFAVFDYEDLTYDQREILAGLLYNT